MIVKLKDGEYSEGLHDFHFNMEYVINIGVKVNNNSAHILATLINGTVMDLLTFKTTEEANKRLAELVKEANHDRLVLERHK